MNKTITIKTQIKNIPLMYSKIKLRTLSENLFEIAATQSQVSTMKKNKKVFNVNWTTSSFKNKNVVDLFVSFILCYIFQFQQFSQLHHSTQKYQIRILFELSFY